MRAVTLISAFIFALIASPIILPVMTVRTWHEKRRAARADKIRADLDRLNNNVAGQFVSEIGAGRMTVLEANEAMVALGIPRQIDIKEASFATVTRTAGDL